ncbi:MAG: DUF2062 domain-containing protein [Hyphomicrobiaceae bacterium]|nr:DUF2062 domain-containing protein [Hyphomicrobiaceae bacterium]
MLFRRRGATSLAERVRVALWPRRSWRRSLRYGVLRLKRLGSTPHALALGIAIGVFMAFQPILGFQMLLAGLLAWALGASVGAALAGTFIGTPATWPLMWLASYWLGAALLGETDGVTTAELWEVLKGNGASASTGMDDGMITADGLLREILRPLAVGAVPLGLLAGAAFYAMVMKAVQPRSGRGSSRR